MYLSLILQPYYIYIYQHIIIMKLSITLLLLVQGIAAIAQPKPAAPKVATTKPTIVNITPKPKYTTLLDSASYVLGYNIGENINKNYPGLNTTVVLKGYQDGNAAKPATIDKNVTQPTMMSYIAKAALLKGEKFLSENKKKKGIITTASGLQYEVITKGTGAKPTLTDSVVVHYSGTLLNGTNFDNSYKRGAPITFIVTGVIAGWVEGLQLMNEGSKYKLYIPSNIAYGIYGNGNIGPNETLLFDIELIKVIHNTPKPTAQPAAPNAGQ